MVGNDLSDGATLRRVVRTVAPDGILVLLLLNLQMAALGLNFVEQLRRHHIEQHLLLTPSAADCAGLARIWRALGERESACGWVSFSQAEHRCHVTCVQTFVFTWSHIYIYYYRDFFTIHSTVRLFVWQPLCADA